MNDRLDISLHEDVLTAETPARRAADGAAVRGRRAAG